MTRFAVARDLDAFQELLGGLEELSRSRGRAGTPPLAGIWIEHPGQLMVSGLGSVHWLDQGPARLGLQISQGRWAVCATEAPVTRATLLRELKAASRVSGATRARFVPVFPAGSGAAGWGHEWLDLADRYPGVVLPPMFADPSGSLRCADPTPVPLQAVAASRHSR